MDELQRIRARARALFAQHGVADPPAAVVEQVVRAVDARADAPFALELAVELLLGR